ncbi:MAG: hypothetical protein IIZ08_06125 [Clostridia bacterium]|jgi:hypothetical protein|nr:hypothetical protein [Clostridia bacterium]
MKFINKYLFPPLMGFNASAISVALCLIIFEYSDFLVSNKSLQSFIDGNSLMLPLILTVSTFFLYAAMLLLRKLHERHMNKIGLEKLGDAKFNSLFMLGAIIAAVVVLSLAFATDWIGATLLVMVAYIIICNLLVSLSFIVLMWFVRLILKLIGKDRDFLNTLKCQLPLSLVYFTIVFMLLLTM